MAGKTYKTLRFIVFAGLVCIGVGAATSLYTQYPFVPMFACLGVCAAAVLCLFISMYAGRLALTGLYLILSIFLFVSFFLTFLLGGDLGFG